jgi:hypothetical protein
LEYHVAMSSDLGKALRDFLLGDPKDEEICFASWYPAVGKQRFTALLHSSIFPRKGERTRHGNVSALPPYVDRAKEFARNKGAGLAIIHTHPLGIGWQGLSEPDRFYERDVLSREVFGVTGYPLVGMTLAGDGTWSARIYERVPRKTPVLKWCSAVRLVGKNLTLHFNECLRPPVEPGETLMRTTSVWGPKLQSDIMRLRVGVIGAGSVGSVVTEILARIGVGEIYLMDYDSVKNHNLDRLLYATRSDVGKSKAKLVQKNAKKSATNPDFKCHAFPRQSIVEEEGFEIAKDCDVLFSCVDRPWPRQVLNHMSYSSLIPVVDGGVSFKTNNFWLVHGMFRAQTVGPGRACLNCLRAYDSGEIQMDREGRFNDPSYIEELRRQGAEPSRQNIMPFSMGLASLETIQFVELVTNIGRHGDLGQQPYDYYTGELRPRFCSCVDGCEYVTLIAKGDTKKPFLAHDISKDRDSTC